MYEEQGTNKGLSRMYEERGEYIVFDRSKIDAYYVDGKQLTIVS